MEKAMTQKNGGKKPFLLYNTFLDMYVCNSVGENLPACILNLLWVRPVRTQYTWGHRRVGHRSFVRSHKRYSLEFCYVSRQFFFFFLLFPSFTAPFHHNLFLLHFQYSRVDDIVRPWVLPTVSGVIVTLVLMERYIISCQLSHVDYGLFGLSAQISINKKCKAVNTESKVRKRQNKKRTFNTFFCTATHCTQRRKGLSPNCLR